MLTVIAEGILPQGQLRAEGLPMHCDTVFTAGHRNSERGPLPMVKRLGIVLTLIASVASPCDWK